MNSIEIIAAASGLLGSLVLSLKGQRAAWGWVLFAISNVGWLVFSFGNSHWAMFTQQIGFLLTSAIGIWCWLIAPSKGPDIRRAQPEPEDFDDGWRDDEPECDRCGGAGVDPWCDYLMPCPDCQGEQRA